MDKHKILTGVALTLELMLPPFLILKTTEDIFLWQLNHPTRPTPYIMPIIFNNNTPTCRPSSSERHQRHRLPERARINVGDISTRAIVATTEPPGTYMNRPLLRTTSMVPVSHAVPVTFASTSSGLNYSWPLAVHTRILWSICRSASVTGRASFPLRPATASLRYPKLILVTYLVLAPP